MKQTIRWVKDAHTDTWKESDTLTNTHTRKRTRTHTHTHIVYVCMHIFICMYIYAYIYIYVCMYACIWAGAVVRLRPSHIKHMNESSYTYFDESCQTFNWVLSHISMRHIAHINESCYNKWESRGRHLWQSRGRDVESRNSRRQEIYREGLTELDEETMPKG